MNPAEIIGKATAAGVILALSPAGTITATGTRPAVDRWLPAIRERKPEILAELRQESRRQKVIAMLRHEPATRYAILVADAAADPVVVAVGIREIATFELEIPRKYYDDKGLLELLEKHSGKEYANT